MTMMTANDTSRSGTACGVRFEGDWLPLAGVAVTDAKTLLRDAGNIPYFADALVNGRPVGAGHVLRHGDRLGFSPRFGIKGSGDRPAEAQAGALVIAYPELTDIAARVKALGLPADRSLDVMAGMVATWAEQRFGPVPNKLEAVMGEIVERLERIESPRVPRTQRELDIIEALGPSLLTGERLAAKAGYEYDGHFKSVLASLVRRGVIRNRRPGYFLPAPPKSGLGQD